MHVGGDVTFQDVAKKLRVSERSVMRYIKAKKLVASKMGQWRIQESDLQSFFNINSNLTKKLSKKYGKRKKF